MVSEIIKRLVLRGVCTRYIDRLSFSFLEAYSAKTCNLHDVSVLNKKILTFSEIVVHFILYFCIRMDRVKRESVFEGIIR